MKKLIFLLSLSLVISGCETTKKEMPAQVPIAELKINYTDVQQATNKCIEDLISQDVLKKENKSKPFVMVDYVENKVLPGINTDVLAQDIRLAILMSDKAVTMPAPEKKKGMDIKKETAKKLPSFDFFLTGEVIKLKAPNEIGEEVDCFAVHFKLKDVKTDLVIWECQEKLTSEAK